MDAVVEKCLNCGTPLKEPRKLKDFCTYSCRGQQAVSTLSGVPHEGAYVGFKNTRKTKALRRLRRQSVGCLRLQQDQLRHLPNRPPGEERCRLARGEAVRESVGWACVGNNRSEPLPLEEAKKAAAAPLHGRGEDEPRDWIKELNQIAANEVDLAYWTREKRKWPIDLMGGQSKKQPIMGVEPELRRAILDTERVLIDEDRPKLELLKDDDVQLEYYSDGFPKPPDCLDRRHKPSISEAA
jgi:hypothetical protein